MPRQMSLSHAAGIFSVRRFDQNQEGGNAESMENQIKAETSR